MKRQFNLKPLFDDGPKRICGHGGPHLGRDSVVVVAQESLDTEMLLDPFEQESDLPTVLVKRDDGRCCPHDQTQIDVGTIEHIDHHFDVHFQIDIPVKLSCVLDWRCSRTGPKVPIVRFAGIGQPVN